MHKYDQTDHFVKNYIQSSDLRPKLKLSLFALYRPTRKYPADSKDFIGKKNIVVFLLVTTVHRITFYSISTKTIAEKL